MKNLFQKETKIFISKDEKIIKKICKESDLIHSAYIGLYHINKLNSINFCKTYGVNENSLYIENIKGIPFNIWIKKHFYLDTYYSIIKKICMALEEAQKECNFIHYDLYPWNVIIKSGGVPIIIDYGKSMVENEDHLILEMVKPYKFHDVLTIMLSSLHDILKYQKLTNYEIKSILKFANLIGNTKYTNNKYFRNLRELKEFLYMEKKFDRMLHSDKYELTNREPKHLYEKM